MTSLAHATKNQAKTKTVDNNIEYLIVISIKQQTLKLYALIDKDKNNENLDFDVASHQLCQTYQISTAKNGIGSLENTGCTPLGRHIIAKKIGANHPNNTVYVGRVPTGEVYDETLAAVNPDRDWILTRIMWLKGCDAGLNKGVNANGDCCDTFERYIYIHGTPDTQPMGVPLSHGCVRMRNDDIIKLFDTVREGTPVLIHKD